MLQITIYGYAVRNDWRGQGDYALLDLTYFLSEDSGLGVREIIDMIEYSGFRFIPQRDGAGNVVQDKVTISEMTVGMEQIEEPMNPNEEMYTYG